MWSKHQILITGIVVVLLVFALIRPMDIASRIIIITSLVIAQWLLLRRR
jgi:hypothetical protein